MLISRPSTPVSGVVDVGLTSPFIAFVHTAHPETDALPLTTVINWGDGPVNGGGFWVDPTRPQTLELPANHIYSKAGLYHIAVTVLNAGQAVGTMDELIHVAQTSPNGRTIRATAGVGFAAELGRISAKGVSSTGLQLIWGDGGFSADTPTVSGADGTILSGNHTYQNPGSYHVVVSVAEPLMPMLIADRVVVHAARKLLLPSALHALRLPLPEQVVLPGALANNFASLRGIPASITSVTPVIDWGDGSPLQSFERDTTGHFVVAAVTHAFQESGNYVVTTTFTDTLTHVRLGRVVKEHVVVTHTSDGARQLQSVTGTQFEGIVGTVDMSPAPTEVGIEWGDGSHSHGTLQQIGKDRYQVSGSHTYRDPGSFEVTITAADGYDPFPPEGQPHIYLSGGGRDDLGYTATVVSTMTVTGLPIPPLGPGASITPLPVPDVTANQSFDATLATLSGFPTDPATAATVFVTIDWGVGPVFYNIVDPELSYDPPAASPVPVEGGKYVVRGSYDYQIWDPVPKTFTVTVTFSLDRDDGTYPVLGSVQTTITVLPANTPGGVTLNLTKGVIFSGSVGATQNGIFVPNSIDWGDGSAPNNAITVTPQSDGTYLVTASHTYAQAGDYRIIVSQVDSQGTSQLIMSRAVVA